MYSFALQLHDDGGEAHTTSDRVVDELAVVVDAERRAIDRAAPKSRNKQRTG